MRFWAMRPWLFIAVTAQPTLAQELSTLYRFNGGRDGGAPNTGVIYVNGGLYGTTISGGNHNCDCGAIFSIDLSTDAETTINALNYKHGGLPTGLAYAGGYLYGTNQYGGPGGFGNVFKANLRDGSVKTLYSLEGGPKGAFPGFPPVYHDEILYGTTDGFSYNGHRGVDCTISSFVPKTHKWHVLYRFHKQSDGISPGALTYHEGFLYGTSLEGGGLGCLGATGCGTVYKVDVASGAETVIHKFRHDDMTVVYPQGVVYVDGMLYGVTSGGGAHNLGEVYKLDPNTGAKTGIYSFKGGNDASLPNSLLTYNKGTFYGTSGYFGGGVPAGCPGNRDSCGTVFAIDEATGAEKVLHRFNGGHDGGLPEGGVIYQDGALYGTTRTGGINNGACSGYNCGTVFKLTLPNAPARSP